MAPDGISIETVHTLLRDVYTTVKDIDNRLSREVEVIRIDVSGLQRSDAAMHAQIVAIGDQQKLVLKALRSRPTREEVELAYVSKEDAVNRARFWRAIAIPAVVAIMAGLPGYIHLILG